MIPETTSALEPAQAPVLAPDLPDQSGDYYVSPTQALLYSRIVQNNVAKNVIGSATGSSQTAEKPVIIKQELISLLPKKIMLGVVTSMS